MSWPRSARRSPVNEIDAADLGVTELVFAGRLTPLGEPVDVNPWLLMVGDGGLSGREPLKASEDP